MKALLNCTILFLSLLIVGCPDIEGMENRFVDRIKDVNENVNKKIDDTEEGVKQQIDEKFELLYAYGLQIFQEQQDSEGQQGSDEQDETASLGCHISVDFLGWGMLTVRDETGHVVSGDFDGELKELYQIKYSGEFILPVEHGDQVEYTAYSSPVEEQFSFKAQVTSSNCLILKETQVAVVGFSAFWKEDGEPTEGSFTIIKNFTDTI